MTWKIVAILIFVLKIEVFSSEDVLKCEDLNKFQYRCENYEISRRTQQSITCSPDNSIQVSCETAKSINCLGKDKITGRFNLTIEDACKYQNPQRKTQYSYPTALILSVFLGFFGIDRIYLGYYAVGLLKMFSLGGLFIFWLFDVVLIALQILGPADGSPYFMPFFGPKIAPISDSYNLTSFLYI